MSSSYNPHKIEQKWQAYWPKERHSYELHEGDTPYYCLDMFPYPSSDGLHMGHWRPYTIADVWARYQTMLGKKVLHPVGFDAFGLPAENAAIKTKTPPQIYTQRSITNFTRQLQEMGNMYDWSTRIVTSTPDYYQWTQWLFVQFYNHGLAYRKLSPVNWCPTDQTVLANEQVIAGVCERCGTKVIKKELKQWYFKITDFADDLLDFSTIDYPERVKTLQTNWIGKSQGTDITFEVANGDPVLSVFTTRPDTLMGVTYLAIAPEHPMVKTLATDRQNDEVLDYIKESSQKSEIDRLATNKLKTGVFTGAYAVHPLTKENVPIWVADYVIASYGTGVVMGVPAHDSRDYQFAKDYNLPIVYVIKPEQGESNTDSPYLDDGILVESGEFNNLQNNDGGKAIVQELEKHHLGHMSDHYRLRDWLVSRQRYWGPPIPIIYCEQCGEQSVPESELPVVLPEDVEFMPGGGSPLDRHPTFKHTSCPKCGGPATRDTDTLDTFVDSSWYYLRYTNPELKDKAFDYDQVKKWLPVDFYVGGVEHATLHLLYARFVMKALHKIGLVPYREPFAKFYGNGLIYLHGKKMSKSRGNVINPDDIVKQFGTDAMRGYILFMGPADQDVEWQTNGITGISRFLERAWKCFSNKQSTESSLSQFTQNCYQEINELLPRFYFNRCISSLMVAINKAEESGLTRNDAIALCQLFAPFFPHFAEEIWQSLGHTESVFSSNWPIMEVRENTHITYAIQVNGKTRGLLETDRNTVKEDLIDQARKLEAIIHFTSGKKEENVIFISGRIINFVVK